MITFALITTSYLFFNPNTKFWHSSSIILFHSSTTATLYS